jgi:probable phosphoglycerate mutase
MTLVLLARHGESDWNAAGRFQGHSDRPLTARGQRQAERLAHELAGRDLAAIYSSPLRRARATADVVAAAVGLPVSVAPALMEVDVGSWAGLTRDQVAERYPDDFRAWRDGGTGWRDGETYEAMGARVVAEVVGIAERHPDAEVLLVCHGGPIRALHAAAEGLDVATYRRLRPVEPNARLSAVVVESGRFARPRSAIGRPGAGGAGPAGT